MEVIGDAKDVARLRPLAIAIPSKQGIVLMGRDSSPGTTNSRSEMPLCPAYRLCKESRGPYRPPMLDTEHDQQITMLHDLLQAIKEAALRLIQLITSVEVRRRKDADPRMHNPDSGRYESSQPRSPGSELIATTSSSVCALCGVSLHLEDSSKESRRFVIDTERSDDYSHDISSKHLDFDNILKTIYEISLAAEKHKKGDNLSIPGSVLDYFFSKENDSIDMRAKGQEKKISSKTQSTDTSENGLKLLFVQQAPSDRTTSQIRQDEPQRKYDSAKQVPKYVRRMKR
ncbi:PREDICTED: uncharacterized protein LOC105452469 [Wasmannia auropunctata]|uniref:uncharacterized protein LOC105452469 n=1 Tax=Wasmannia auropunctata TaxID=64793 RepID=UPI0005EEA56C|nr:PREDICTED: uncharacterized protein LOC105452469 [Wasmannia auropunctata]